MNLGFIAVAGFASGWMLLWAAAAAIPLVLHFLYRRRQVTMPWAAMQLLLQVIEKEARRVRIEQLLLLLLRCCVLLVLAAALARPFWDSDDVSAVTGSSPPAVTWILAVDVSYSMAYRPAEQTRLEAAKERAMEIIETAGPNDAFSLVALGQPARAVIAWPTFDRQSALAEVRRLTINDAGCDLSVGLQLISDIAQAAKQEELLSNMVRIIVLSDLGQDHWQSAVDGADAKRLRSIAEKYQLEIEPLGDEEVSNVAITSIQPLNLRAVVGLPLEVDVSVSNFGAVAVQQLPVQLNVEGQTVASDYLNLDVGGSATVRLSVTPQTLGQLVLTATIPADRLATDNSRGCVIEVRDEYNILFVERRQGDARVLSLSLSAGKSVRQTRNLSTISTVELPAADLSEYQVVVLNDLESIDSSSYLALQRFVKQGGAVVCLWGPRANPDIWNAREEAATLQGFQLLEPSSVGDWTIDPLDYRSPVVAPFAGFPDAGLLTTPIFKYWKIDTTDGDSTLLTDLALTEGDPLIVRHKLEEGCVASVLSAPQSGSATDESWNAMLTWPSFVPLINRLVQAALDTGVESHTILAGQPLRGREIVSNEINNRGTPIITILKPDGSESQIATEDVTPQGIAPWVFTQTQHSGVYYARDNVGTEQPYVVNIAPVESSLRSVPPTQLPRSPEPVSVEVGTNIPTGSAAEHDLMITRALLVSLGMLLVAESLLAWFLGRRAG